MSIDLWHIIHPVGMAATGVLMWGTFAPSSRLWGSMARRGDATRPAVALTFDDGPTPGSTEQVLDTLAAAGVRATFFVVGLNCDRHPGLVRRMHAEGHLVANHTYDHSHFGVFRRRGFWDEQLRRTDASIAAIVGKRPALFRPPMGHKTPHTFAAAKKLGYATVGWSRSAGDGLATTSDKIARRLARSGPGDILLLHDGVEPNIPRRDQAATVAALPGVLANLKARGLDAVRLDELLSVKGYQDGAPRPG
ncbi:MAG TPA: polysaccharide deacetylase family protein [Humisphaera sp.]